MNDLTEIIDQLKRSIQHHQQMMVDATKPSLSFAEAKSNSERQQIIDKNTRIVAELDAVRWRKVSDGKPDKSGQYMVVLNELDDPFPVALSYYDAANGRWTDINDSHLVTHYRPISLPKEA